jgi:hypothetical protein
MHDRPKNRMIYILLLYTLSNFCPLLPEQQTLNASSPQRTKDPRSGESAIALHLRGTSAINIYTKVTFFLKEIPFGQASKLVYH